MVEKYMTMIIRKVLANQRGVNPVEVKDEEVIKAYKNDKKGDKKMKKEFKIIDWVEQNPFADPRKANNGGGYSQPRIDFTLRGIKGFINDTSCGDFGDRVEIVYGNKEYYLDSVSKEYIEYSDFSKYKDNDRQAVKEIEKHTGYRVLFKEEI